MAQGLLNSIPNVRVVDVILWGRKIGALAFDGEKNIASFEYVSEFLGSKIEIALVMICRCAVESIFLEIL